MRPRIVNIFHSFPSAVLRAAHNAGHIEHICLPSPELSVSERREWLKSQLPGASAAIIWVNVGRFGKEHLDVAGETLKVVATYSVGYDHIDVDELKRRGVAVAHTPYKSDDAVANATLLLLLMALRRSAEHLDVVRHGKWLQFYNDTSSNPLALAGGSVQDCTVGFYGFGRIAQKVAERILPLGPRRILYKASSPRSFTADTFPRLHHVVSTIYPGVTVSNEPDLQTLAAESDVLVCLTSLVPETHHSVNEQVLSKMKKHAVLVNVSRGPVVDTQALLQALKKEQISCVALDVLEGEPDIAADHPVLDDSLRHKVVIMPHSGSAEAASRTEMADLTARNVLKALNIDIRPEWYDEQPVPTDRSTYFV
ncbi:hypothetical protein EXIGLDRAFT_730672 [Exidia glandulosa HHB12029]|uniref:Glyoxylate reductase n=1 Tax=Exidia glandulosa HHB12029 TaxID=1314781 RepID=A0A165L797_EXIGL|nr:hypothetical protein EXIGLDRAFT_730672 [Exidia glandulosa HHB12029]